MTRLFNARLKPGSGRSEHMLHRLLYVYEMTGRSFMFIGNWIWVKFQLYLPAFGITNFIMLWQYEINPGRESSQRCHLFGSIAWL